MHDERYATTRRLVTEKPACFDNSLDGITTLIKTPDSDQKIAEGGLRLQGFFKEGSEDKPLITVVTVVYNGAEFLEETIKSVVEQTYDNVEYIIVDGGSKDGTLDIIRKYEHAIDYWVSEPDKGIYDAMNKGVGLVSGGWINFMNAGDLFFNCEILSRTYLSPEKYNGFGVVYGDHEVRYFRKAKTVKSGNVKSLWKGSQFCHQSTFVRASLQKNNKFNLSKKIAADYDLYLTLRKKETRFYKSPFLISSVTSGGVSDLKRDAVFEEWRESSSKIFTNFKWLINVYYFFLKQSFFIKKGIKKIIE
jgi:glycosyltransferase involved in cell wall biosynthesis